MSNLKIGGWQFPSHNVEGLQGSMPISIRQYLNLADSQKPKLVCFRNGVVSYSAAIYRDEDPDKDEWILIFFRDCGILFTQTVNEEYGLGHLMHLADMAFEDKEWLEKLQDPTYIDEYQLSQITEDDLPIYDTPEPHGPEISNEEFMGTLQTESDPLDYKFGESACCVFERWSKELKKMREKLK